MGGVTVQTSEQVKVYTEMLKEPVQIGQHIEESACVPETHPQWIAALEAGRDCPRVDLDPDDELPYALLHYQAYEHTREMFWPKFYAAAGHLPPEEQEAILDRTQAGLTCTAVMDRLYPKPKERDGSKG